MPGENTMRLQPFIRSSNDTLDPPGHAHIDSFTVTGPFNATGPGDTPSRRKIFICRPAGRMPRKKNPVPDEDPHTLAHRAYRGLETTEDLDRLMEFYRKGRSEGI